MIIIITIFEGGDFFKSTTLNVKLIILNCDIYNRVIGHTQIFASAFAHFFIFSACKRNKA